MKKTMILMCGLILFGILAQPASARLAASYEQKIIEIDHVEKNGNIVSSEGDVFIAASPREFRKKNFARGQQVRILYVVMGDKWTIAEINPVSEPPFTVPNTNAPGKRTGRLK